MTAVRRLMASDAVWALAIILPTMAGIAAIGTAVYAVCIALRESDP